jgi:hypothetical protein
MTGITPVNTAADLQCIPIVQQGTQVSVIHLVQKIGGELLQILIHRGIVVDDDVKHLTAAGFNGQKLLVGVLVVLQAAGNGVALFKGF